MPVPAIIAAAIAYGPEILTGLAVLLGLGEAASGCATSRGSEVVDSYISAYGQRPDWLTNPAPNTRVGKSPCIRIGFESAPKHIQGEVLEMKLRTEGFVSAVNDIISQQCGVDENGSSRGTLYGVSPYTPYSYPEKCSIGDETGIRLYLKGEKEDIKCRN